MKFGVKIFYLVGVAFILASCGPGSQAEIDALREEVISIHDEVMPKMGELKALSKEIVEKANLLRQEDSISNSGQIVDLVSLSVKMDQAFDGMFVWMRQFNSSYDGLEEEQISEYLQDQKQKVEIVNRDIKTSIQEAKERLGKN
jgi:hypothetical protein